MIAQPQLSGSQHKWCLESEASATMTQPKIGGTTVRGCLTCDRRSNASPSFSLRANFPPQLSASTHQNCYYYPTINSCAQPFLQRTAQTICLLPWITCTHYIRLPWCLVENRMGCDRSIMKCAADRAGNLRNLVIINRNRVIF